MLACSSGSSQSLETSLVKKQFLALHPLKLKDQCDLCADYKKPRVSPSIKKVTKKMMV